MPRIGNAPLALALAALLPPLAAGRDSATFALTQTRVATIPGRFVSFSIEVSKAPDVFLVGGLGGAPRASFARLMNALRAAAGDAAGAMIRVGGNSADESAYTSSASLPAGTTYRITDADLDAYKAAVPAWNGSLVIDTTLRYPGSQGTQLDVAHLAAAVERVGFALIEGVELGNEVDLFFENGIRSPSYDYNDHKPEFELANDAVAPVLAPGGRPRIQGATWCSPHWSLSNYSDYVASFGSSFGSISIHRYAESVCHNDKATIPGLMADKSAAGLAQAAQPYVERAGAIPVYIGEGNSVSCGGADGVSNVWASALWALDALFNVAAVGFQRWSFHGMPEGSYSTILFPSGSEDVAQVQPLFYGLWAFATAAANGAEIREVTTTQNSNLFIKAWSVTDRAGETRVVLLHKDPAATQNASITITPAGGALSGAATIVRGLPGAKGMTAAWRDAISFGGLTFSTSTDGLPTGTPASESVPASGGGAFSFELPPASFVILTLPGS
jgi:hypothetical protein